MDRMPIINKLKDLEDKRQDLEYLISACGNKYVEEINIETKIITKEFGFKGDRFIEVGKSYFVGYLKGELRRTEDDIDELINRLGVKEI